MGSSRGAERGREDAPTSAQHSSGQEIGPLRWAPVKPGTFDEMREQVWQTELPKQGDTVLVWVNEGDLYMHSMFGRYTFQNAQPLGSERSDEDGQLRDEPNPPSHEKGGLRG